MDATRGPDTQFLGRGQPDILLVVRVVVLIALLTVSYGPAGGFTPAFLAPLGLSSAATAIALLRGRRPAEPAPRLLPALDLLALATFVFLLHDQWTDFYLVCLYVLLIGAAGPGLTLSLTAASVAAAAQALAAWVLPREGGLAARALLLRSAFLVVSAVLLAFLAREAERERQARHATRRELSARIADLSEFLNAILQSIHTGVLVVNPEGIVVLCNRRASEILGASAADLVDRPLAAAAWLDPLRLRLEAAGAGASARDEIVLARRDGRTVELGLGIAPLTDPAGRATGASLVFQDITPLKEAQRGLVRQERLAVAGRLAGGVAHEFGNLLGGLRGHAEFALQDGRPEELREALDITARNIDRALHIVRNLLAFSRPSPPRRERCDVGRILGDALLLIERDLGRQRVTVERSVPEGLHVEGDPVQLQQAFLNLLINARQAMPSGGALRVAAAREGERVRISVADTGPGIPAEARDRLFEPFFTTKTGEGGEPPGTGLGLAITRDIVSGHGGTIDVACESGPGATFTLTLPAAAAGTGLSTA